MGLIVLLGCIQSDNIESRFGWYRQLSGGNYFISVKQILDSERKIKTISLLKYNAIIKRDAYSYKLAESLQCELLLNMIPSKQDQSIIYYVIGACARSVVRTKKCESCKETLILIDDAVELKFEDTPEAADFLKEINRGGLIAPQEWVFQLGLLCWQIFYEIKETASLKNKFMKGKNHKQTLCDTVEMTPTVEHFDTFFGRDLCTSGHNVILEISERFFRCMSKNFIKEMSQMISGAAKKRGAEKLSGVTM